MSYYKHWSGILQKAAKGFRLQKQRPNQDSWHFQLSHCCFILAPTFLPFLTSTNNNKSVAWFFWKKWERHWNFDIFDWKLVLSSISQGQSYNQKVALFRCPSDLTNFVKICAFVQSLEVILERSDSLGWELPVLLLLVMRQPPPQDTLLLSFQSFVIQDSFIMNILAEIPWKAQSDT